MSKTRLFCCRHHPQLFGRRQDGQPFDRFGGAAIDTDERLSHQRNPIELAIEIGLEDIGRREVRRRAVVPKSDVSRVPLEADRVFGPRTSAALIGRAHNPIADAVSNPAGVMGPRASEDSRPWLPRAYEKNLIHRRTARTRAATSSHLSPPPSRAGLDQRSLPGARARL